MSFDNPDFVDVVIHSYRLDFGPAAGDPTMEELESRLARKPPITVPAITIDGTQDPLKPGGTADHGKMFKAKHEHRVVECGHNLPWEAPEEFADAVLALRSWQRISGDVLARLANSGSSGASSRLQWKFLPSP